MDEKDMKEDTKKPKQIIFNALKMLLHEPNVEKISP